MNYQGNSNIVQINTNSNYSNSQDHNDGDTEKSRTNLIVNYIPQNMTNDEFVDVFKQIGSLKSCKIIRDKTSGNSFGFGFAEYYDPTHATQAVNELNGMQIKDKQIKVAYAKALSQIKSGNLYVRFLPPEFSDKEIRNLFEPYGTISTCRILKNDQGMSRGVAFVLYDREESAKIAMESLDDTILIAGSEQRISVKFADDAKQKHKFNKSRQGNGMNGGGGGGGGGAMHQNQNNMAMQQQQIQLQNQMLMQQQALFQQLQQQLAAQMSGQQPQMQNQFSQGMSTTGPIRNSRNNNRYNPMGGDNTGVEGGDMQAGQMAQMDNASLGQVAGGQMQNQLGQMNNMAQLISSLMGNNNQMAMANQQGVMAGGMQTGMQQNQQNGDFAQFEHTAKNKDGYTLFVYNTGPECTEDQLRTLFSQYGVLNKVALMKDESGKSRGFAFVSMPSFDNACSAINGLNGYLLINGTYSNKLQVSFKVKK